MCETCHEYMKKLDEHMTLQTQLQRELLQHQISSVPKYLTQARLYLQNATSLNFAYHTQSQILMHVTTMIVTVSSAATLIIQDRTWNFNGFTIQYFGKNGLLIRPEDLITLTQASSGNLGLEFLGQEMADRGKRW